MDQTGLLSILPTFSYTVTHRPTSAALSNSSQSAIGPRYEEAVRRLRGIAAAIGSGEDPVTEAYVSPSDSSNLGLRLVAERTSPFARRLIRVQVQRAVPVVLDEAIVDVDTDVEPAVARDSILQWMAQFGISENNLVQIASERSYSSNPSPVRYSFTVTKPVRDAEAFANTIKDRMRDRPRTWRSASVTARLRTSERAATAARESALPDMAKQAREQAEALAG